MALGKTWRSTLSWVQKMLRECGMVFLAVVRLSFYFIFISTMNTNVYNFCGTAVTCLENTLGE